MRVVDAHAHFFSRAFFEALGEESPLPGDVPAKLARLAAETGVELPDPDPVRHWERWRSQLDARGVARIVFFASHPREIGALEAAHAASGGRIAAVAIADPRAPGAADRVRSLLSGAGFRGVLLFPAMHRFHVGGPETEELLAAVDERAGLVYVHCGILVVPLRDRLGLPRRRDLAFANPLGVVPAADRFPRARFVIPHFGAGFFRETLMAGAQCGNIYVDTSSSNAWRAVLPEFLTLAHVFERALGVFGHERILFGTDSGTFPAGWRGDRLDEQVKALRRVSVPTLHVEAILGGNTERLLA